MEGKNGIKPEAIIRPNDGTIQLRRTVEDGNGQSRLEIIDSRDFLGLYDVVKALMDDKSINVISEATDFSGRPFNDSRIRVIIAGNEPEVAAYEKMLDAVEDGIKIGTIQVKQLKSLTPVLAR